MGTSRYKYWILKTAAMVFNIARYAFIVTSLFVAAEVSNPGEPGQVTAPRDKQLTILFAGDIMQHGPQINSAWDDSTQTYNYNSCFQYIAPIVSSKDIAIANLEVTLAGKPFTGYPQFSAPDELAVAAGNAGFDILATANNHSCDRGDEGVLRTIKVLDSLGMKRTGTFADSADYRKNHPLIFTQNDIKVALLNYTYGTNGLPFNYPAMVNILEEQKVINDLAYTKGLNPDFILVFFHWGNEYELMPTEQQHQLAAVCREHGADAVIGSHPHVVQPMEYHAADDTTQRNHLLVYSLGNYVSNQRDRYKDGGAMVSFTLLKTWNRKTIIDPEYHLTWVYTPVEKGKKNYYIVPVNVPYKENQVLASSDLIKESRQPQDLPGIGVENNTKPNGNNDNLQSENGILPWFDREAEHRLRNMDSLDVNKMNTFLNDTRERLNQWPNAISEADYK